MPLLECAVNSITLMLLLAANFGASSAMDCSLDICPPDRGTCVTVTGSFPTSRCLCFDDLTGPTCSKRLWECDAEKDPCRHGRCRLPLGSDRPYCLCDEGYTGQNCSEKRNPCLGNTCTNGAQCLPSGSSSHTCLCPHATSGERCQIRSSAIADCLSRFNSTSFASTAGPKVVRHHSVYWGYSSVCSMTRDCAVALNETGGVVTDVQMVPLSADPHDIIQFIADPQLISHKGTESLRIYQLSSSQTSSFRRCDPNEGVMVVNQTSPQLGQTLLQLNSLAPGRHYFIMMYNNLYRCEFGLRLNVTVSDPQCAADDSEPPCGGRGACRGSRETGFHCDCCPGYVGHHCDIEDPCFEYGCLNGGTCLVTWVNSVAKRECACLPSFNGMRCERAIDACSNAPCVNEGLCVANGTASYTCICPAGFSGQRCQLVTNICTSKPCRNQGRCIPNITAPLAFSCKCRKGYEGYHCEVDTNDCIPNPCHRGSCIDLVGGAVCLCPPGYTGDWCEKTLPACSVPGMCVSGSCSGDGSVGPCICHPGYSGAICDQKLDLCSNDSFCQYSTSDSCVNLGSNVRCHCQPGYTGSNCAVNINDCTPDVCLPGVVCLDQVAGYQCITEKSASSVINDEHVVLRILSDSCPNYEEALRSNISSLQLQLWTECGLQSGHILTVDVLCLDLFGGSLQLLLDSSSLATSLRCCIAARLHSLRPVTLGGPVNIVAVESSWTCHSGSVGATTIRTTAAAVELSPMTPLISSTVSVLVLVAVSALLYILWWRRGGKKFTFKTRTSGLYEPEVYEENFRNMYRRYDVISLKSRLSSDSRRPSSSNSHSYQIL